MKKMILVLFAAAAGAAAVAAPAAPALPPYAESAFPAAVRPQIKARLTAEFHAAIARAQWVDAKLAQTFKTLPADSLVRIRIAKRQQIRSRLFLFIKNNLQRGDATGLGFAEQGIADAATLDRMMEREIPCWQNAPRKENAPVVLNVKDFGARGDGKGDDAPAFQKACAAIRALGGRPSILRIPAGTYRMATLYRPRHITDARGERTVNRDLQKAQCLFENLENCSIEGDSPATTTILSAVYKASQVELLNCRNVTLKRINVEMEKVPFLEGRVTAFDPATGACDVRLVPGSLLPDDPCWKPAPNERFESYGFGYDPKGQLMLNCRLIPWNGKQRCQKLPDGQWRLFFDRTENTEMYDQYVKNIPVGGTIVLPNRCNYYGGVQIRYSSCCTVEEVWVRNSRSSAFYAPRSVSTTFFRCKVFPRKGFTHATNADGCMTDPGAFLYQCTFDKMGDDGLNVLRYAVVTEMRPDPTEIAHEDRGINLGGALGVFADSASGQYLAHRRLTQTDAVVKLPEGWKRVTRFTEPVPADCRGAFFYEPRQSAIGTAVIGCSWSNGRLAGNVIQSSNVLLENNRYVNLYEGGRIGALGDFKEGPPPYNVLVRNCTFEKDWSGLLCYIRMRTKDNRDWARIQCAPIRFVTAAGNTFTDQRVAISVQHAGDSRFTGNTFIRCGRNSLFECCENVIHKP